MFWHVHQYPCAVHLGQGSVYARVMLLKYYYLVVFRILISYTIPFTSFRALVPCAISLLMVYLQVAFLLSTSNIIQNSFRWKMGEFTKWTLVNYGMGVLVNFDSYL